MWTFSSLIDRLADHLRVEGVAVDLQSTRLPDGITGLFDGGDGPGDAGPPRIEINEPSLPLALLTLAHEAGHFRAWQRGEQPEGVVERERLARKYGLRALRRIGVRLKPGVWKRFHDSLTADGRYQYRDEGPEILAAVS